MSKEIKEGFKFLKGDIMKHPTTGINLEYLVKQDAVAIALFDENIQKVLLVEQFRPGANKNIFEIPAGLIDENEDAKNAVIRELQEETGYTNEDIVSLISLDKPLLFTPGYSTEKVYFFAAKLKSNDIQAGECSFDEGEDITTHWVKIEDILNFDIDAKTLLAINYFKDKF